ncbi:MAG TPA: M23 family metallopeptidase [Anaerolineaceae bacterium]
MIVILSKKIQKWMSVYLAASILLTVRPVNASSIVWFPYRSERFGFSLRYPSDLGAWDRLEGLKSPWNGVPSEIWFGPHIRLTVRTPALPTNVVERWWKESQLFRLNNGYTARQVTREDRLIVNEWILIQRDGIDLILSFNYNGYPTADSQRQRSDYHEIARTIEFFPPVDPYPPAMQDITAADGFDFPVNPPEGGEPSPSYASFSAVNPYLLKQSTCYGALYSTLQHTAEDYFRQPGTPVYAAASGLVIFATDAAFPGAVVVIEHQLDHAQVLPSPLASRDDMIYSAYGHLDVLNPAPAWSMVKRGQHIGTILDQGANSHLHFEIRWLGDLTGRIPCTANPANNQSSTWAGPGYAPPGISAESLGYLPASRWINTHRPHPAGWSPRSRWLMK